MWDCHTNAANAWPQPVAGGSELPKVAGPLPMPPHQDGARAHPAAAAPLRILLPLPSCPRLGLRQRRRLPPPAVSAGAWHSGRDRTASPVYARRLPDTARSVAVTHLGSDSEVGRAVRFNVADVRSAGERRELRRERQRAPHPSAPGMLQLQRGGRAGRSLHCRRRGPGGGVQLGARVPAGRSCTCMGDSSRAPGSCRWGHTRRRRSVRGRWDESHTRSVGRCDWWVQYNRDDVARATPGICM